jgi:hypothetical protein
MYMNGHTAVVEAVVHIADIFACDVVTRRVCLSLMLLVQTAMCYTRRGQYML